MKSWHSDFDKRFNRMNSAIMWFVGIMMALMVCAYISVGVLL